MRKENIKDLAHEIPTDLRKALASTPEAKIAWENITSRARNEWICWVISAKKPETRKRRIERMCDDLVKDKRRPCCWPGCSHR